MRAIIVSELPKLNKD